MRRRPSALRRKQQQQEDEIETTTTTAAVTAYKKTKNTLLSFAEEEEENSQVKLKKKKKKKPHTSDKSSTNKGLVVPAQISQPGSVAAFPSHTGGEYSQKDLDQLRKNSRFFSSGSSQAVKIASDTDAPILALSGSPSVFFKKKDSENENTLDLGSSAITPLCVDPIDLKIIPSDRAIAAAKEKREKLRTMEYIPLDDEEDESSADEENEISDDELVYGEHGKQVKFGHPKENKLSLKEQLQQEEQEEDDDELRRWELEQMKKGGAEKSRRAARAMQKEQMVLGGISAKKKMGYAGDPQGDGALIFTPTETVSSEVIQKQLEKDVMILKNQQAADTQSLEELEKAIIADREHLTQLEQDAVKKKEHYSFFVDMRQYLANLLDFLGEKAPQIEAFEEALAKAERECCEKRRSSEQSALKKRLEEHKAQLHVSNGPDLSQGWSFSRSRRRDISFNEIINTVREGTLSEAHHLFDDVESDYCSILQAKKRLEKWKFSYPAEYEQAYCSDCIPALFSPLVRYEFLEWNPWDDPAFDTMGWYISLIDFGLNNASSDGPPDLDADDTDLNLVPTLLERVVFPRAKHIFANCLDPFSLWSSQKAHQIVEELLPYTQPTAETFRGLLTAVVITFDGAVQESSIPLWSPGEENNQNRAFRFTCELFWRTFDLAECIISWKKYLTGGVIQRLVIDNLLNSKLLPFLRLLPPKECVIACVELINILPCEWFEEQLESLCLFRDFISRLAENPQIPKEDILSMRKRTNFDKKKIK